MPKIMQDLIKQYVEAVKKIYGSHVRQIILYHSMTCSIQKDTRLKVRSTNFIRTVFPEQQWAAWDFLLSK